jgi:poly(3-hydroxybutyrate) depolymerase
VSFPRRAAALLALLIGLLTLLIAPQAASARAVRVRIPAEPLVAALPVPQHSIYTPSNAAARGPLQVLVALHGMGWDGSTFAAPLVAQAERQGWLLVAPTFAYGDWRDPEQVRRDDTTFIPQLKALLDTLPARTGLQTRPRALLYGFSRGGQLAHRFALFYPASVAGVATFSCGTFTLPYTAAMPQAQGLALNFPFAVGDLERYTGRPLDLDNLRKVSFLVGVGAADTAGGDLPRQWDHLGTNRLDRASAYHQALDGLGIPAQMAIFPNTGHGENDEMRAHALGFLATLAR